jgi:hypothetical protein
MALGSSHVDLIPPVGSKGLPLTLLLADAYDDTITGDVDRIALFDTSLHQSRATGSGTVINPSPTVPSVILNLSGTHILRPTAEKPYEIKSRAEGLTTNTSPPVLNLESGALEFAQTIQDISRSYHSNSEIRSSVPMTRLSLTEAGRFTPHPRRRYSSGRPANHTWHQTKTTDDDVVIATDKSWGYLVASGTFDCTHPAYADGGRVEGIAHFTKADLPSNGVGMSWGDAHNSTFHTTLFSTPVKHTAGSDMGIELKDDDFKFSSHWGLNLGVRQQILASGSTISAPDGLPILTSISEDVDSQNLLYDSETIQTICVSDIFSDGTGTPDSQADMTLGRVDLGNHVVADSCGLIGYEGVITATGFFNISKNSDRDQKRGAISESGGFTYGGLNIQVHSGSTLRRNGDPANPTGFGGLTPFGVYRYGSDGASVDVMTDALKTSAHRTGEGFSTTLDGNASQFSTRRYVHHDETPTQAPEVIGHHEVELGAADGGVFCQASSVADRLIGTTDKAGDSLSSTEQTLGSGWLSDMIPTKVQIVPQVRGYKDVVVSAGDVKESVHGLAAPINFRKPIVDYHILVSAVARSEIGNVIAQTDSTNTNIGDPTTRNNPYSNRLHADMDLSGLPCTIYHGIVRIEPDALEQIFIDPSEIPSNYDITQAVCPFSVMPRHTKMLTNSGRAAMGWGLHQITPFRPISSRQWVRVPKLCGAIEAGGFYQRGGVSHLWDADVYGGELFVGADMIDATDFATEGVDADGNATFGIWGSGQITTDGTPTPSMPQGSELLIFRYSPHKDPYHPKNKTTSRLNNPVRDALGSNAGITTSESYSAQYKTGYAITDERLLAFSAWDVHDWVIPQIELMRYLGKEDKSSRRHPKHSESDGTEIILHPTVHCSSLRIMEDGRMQMAMVHRDYISTVDEYPSSDVGYPANPDLNIGSCPVGYYFSDGQCIPIAGSGAVDGGNIEDPETGDSRPAGGYPSPNAGSDSETPTNDNFGSYPTWSKIKANTSARSLILAFTNSKADERGKIRRGRFGFCVNWVLVPISDEETQELATQSWTFNDNWWSGARISYWFEESGQRAIPITYGSYPECRMSHAVLPRSIPHLDADLKVKEGYPFSFYGLAPHPDKNSILDAGTRLLDDWYRNRYSFLKFTKHVPTTIGFADFGAGANPHQELGWSGWSFPTDLYDPIGYGDGTDFFRDSTTQEKWLGFGDNKDYATGAHTPYAAVEFDLSGISFPCQILNFEYDGVEQMIAPVHVANAADVVSALTGVHSIYTGVDAAEFFPYGGALTSSGTTVIRKFQDAPTIAPQMYDTNGNLKFSLMRFDTGEEAVIRVVPSVESLYLMKGPLASWSYHGPLHYGLSATHHPYRVDRVFKQIHAGLGYDVPLHLLIPPRVHVRARAGGNGQIDLEMETPFHRTDNLHLEGPATSQTTGFELGGDSPPTASRSPLGQWYLRTNLWDSPITNSANTYVSGITLFDQRIHGPVISGSKALSAFWQDHPTDHFHASAMPILPNTDYDLAMIETNRYSPLMLARSSELNELDVLASGEQLVSSVDVHVSQTARPYWDSGAIVSAQGIGQEDAMDYIDGNHGELPYGNGTHFPYVIGRGGSGVGLGKGQRILRTPEGTLHQFVIKRSIVAGANYMPTWNHLKKPLNSDLFWSRRAMTPNADTATGDGKDECRPILGVDLTIGTSTGDRTKEKLMGAAYCSDSKGTIHAVIEVHVNPNDESEHRAHRLYYTKADRYQVGYNPEPVYDWDWSIHTPVLINDYLDSNDEEYGTRYDFRFPSLVCDEKDTLHLTITQVMESTKSDWTSDVSRILYTFKRDGEDCFPLAENFDAYGDPPNDLWSVVNDTSVDTSDADANNPNNSHHKTAYNARSKVCLRSDGLPVIFWLGSAVGGYTNSARIDTSIYTNIGVRTGTLITFDKTKACHVIGAGPDSRNQASGFYGQWFDAIIDENDKAVSVLVFDDDTTSGTPSQTFAKRQTLMNRFDTRLTLAEQYTTTDGLGDTRTLFMGPAYDGTTELRYIDTHYEHTTLTTNGKGEYHLVMGFTMTGEDGSRQGAVFRDATLATESGINPLQWAGTPLTGSGNTLYTGGYSEASTTPDWTQTFKPPYSVAYSATYSHHHLMHVWFPSYEFDDDATASNRVIRSINIRWLSVPSLRYDATEGWQPIGSAQTLAGQEDFMHSFPQIRYQRFWGYDASEIDLSWRTNERAWKRTPHDGSRVYYPSLGGVSLRPAGDLSATGEGVQGFPSGI